MNDFHSSSLQGVLSVSIFHKALIVVLYDFGLHRLQLKSDSVKKPAQGHLAGKQGSWSSECKT